MKVLLVEDEFKISQAIKKGLMQERFSVDISNNGKEGLDLSLSENYDLIILDRLLPEVDGISICKRIRSSDKKDTPILMLTALGQLRDRVEGLNCGADDYLAKPFAFEELVARVRALTRRPKIRIEKTIRIGSLVMDIENYSVRVGEKILDLSNKEFLLLQYLMKNKNQTVTKEKIIENVWSFDADVLQNSVEVFIKHLRDKVEKPLGKKIIKTVRGFGYKLLDY